MAHLRDSSGHHGNAAHAIQLSRAAVSASSGSVQPGEYLAGGALPGSQGAFHQSGPGAGGVLAGEMDAAGRGGQEVRVAGRSGTTRSAQVAGPSATARADSPCSVPAKACSTGWTSVDTSVAVLVQNR